MRLYIDPGTGSMLFSILIGVIGAGYYFLRSLFIKMKYSVKKDKEIEKESSGLKYAIFSDSKRYWNVFEPICDEFEKRGEPLTYMTASEDDPALKKNYEHVDCLFIGEGNKAFARLNMLKADILLATTPGLDVYQWKRSRDVKYYVHIPHAMGDIVIYRMFGIDYFDAVLLNGEYQIGQVRKIEELRNLPPKELLLVGQPYMDTLKARVEKAEKPKNDTTTVLLAPSWGKSGIFSRYGGEIIEALLKSGYHVIARPHPQSFTAEKELMEKLMAEYPESEQLEWNRDNDNFDVLLRSDIMISDFSGVMFDFALVFDKPLIYADTSFDPAPYDACWLEGELWTFETLRRIGRPLTRENLGEIRTLIENCLHDTQFQESRDRARREAWAHPGESASLVVDYMLNKHKELFEQPEQETAETKDP